MKNYVQDGDKLDYTLTAAVSSGDVIEFADCIGVAAVDGVSGDVISVLMRGVVNIAKLSTDVFAVGDKVYWDATNNELTSTATSNIPVGVAAAAAANGTTTANVLLNPGV